MSKVVALIFLITNIVNSQRCSFENEVSVIRVGKCMRLFGGSMACRNTDYMEPESCVGKSIDSDCEIRTTRIEVIEGICKSLGNTKLCVTEGDRMIAYSSDCLELINN